MHRLSLAQSGGQCFRQRITNQREDCQAAAPTPSSMTAPWPTSFLHKHPAPLRTEGSQGWVEVHHPQELHQPRQEAGGRENERLVLVDDRVRSHYAVAPQLKQLHRPDERRQGEEGREASRQAHKAQRSTRLVRFVTARGPIASRSGVVPSNVKIKHTDARRFYRLTGYYTNLLYFQVN